jgi:hypothetical protein
MTELVQIIYVSQPFGYDIPTLNGILLESRRNNSRDGITGALICRHDIYFQLIEGPETKVQTAFERITRDDRHVGMKPLVSAKIKNRIFADWAMLHDPATSLIWTEKEISDGILDNTTEVDIRHMFETLAENVKKNGPPV